MKDYFQILGLHYTADLNEVKQAYRVLAKQYHPDVSASPDAQQKFIQVNEAYEFLRDDDRRNYYVQSRRTAASEVEQRRREALYNEWVRRQQAAARSRAEANAHDSFDAFSKSPIYRTAMVINQLYNYIFLGIGLMLIFAPLIWYFGMTSEEREEMHISVSSIIFPGLLGLAFTYGIYYFIFKKHE